MPSNSQPPTRRRGRSRLQLQTHQVEELTRQVEGLTRQVEGLKKRADEQDRRWFMRNVIMPISITFGGGWLFWRLPPPHPQQGRDVQFSAGTRHRIRGGGNIDVQVEANAHLTTSVSATVEVDSAWRPPAARV